MGSAIEDNLNEELQRQVGQCEFQLEKNIRHGVADPFYEQDILLGQISGFKAVINFIKSGQWNYTLGRTS